LPKGNDYLTEEEGGGEEEGKEGEKNCLSFPYNQDQKILIMQKPD
jgi:hypothetical protein